MPKFLLYGLPNSISQRKLLSIIKKSYGSDEYSQTKVTGYQPQTPYLSIIIRAEGEILSRQLLRNQMFEVEGRFIHVLEYKGKVTIEKATTNIEDRLIFIKKIPFEITSKYLFKFMTQMGHEIISISIPRNSSHDKTNIGFMLAKTKQQKMELIQGRFFDIGQNQSVQLFNYKNLDTIRCPDSPPRYEYYKKVMTKENSILVSQAPIVLRKTRIVNSFFQNSRLTSQKAQTKIDKMEQQNKDFELSLKGSDKRVVPLFAQNQSPQCQDMKNGYSPQDIMSRNIQAGLDKIDEKYPSECLGVSSFGLRQDHKGFGGYKLQIIEEKLKGVKKSHERR